MVSEVEPRLQGEDRADLAHRHLADQRLEVLALGHPLAGLAEIAVEDPNALRPPAELLGLALQIVLPLRALLVEANLSRRRLANVDAGIARQVSLGDLRYHCHRAPPDRMAGHRRQDRIRSYWRERRPTLPCWG